MIVRMSECVEIGTGRSGAALLPGCKESPGERAFFAARAPGGVTFSEAYKAVAAREQRDAEVERWRADDGVDQQRLELHEAVVAHMDTTGEADYVKALNAVLGTA